MKIQYTVGMAIKRFTDPKTVPAQAKKTKFKMMIYCVQVLKSKINA